MADCVHGPDAGHMPLCQNPPLPSLPSMTLPAAAGFDVTSTETPLMDAVKGTAVRVPSSASLAGIAALCASVRASTEHFPTDTAHVPSAHATGVDAGHVPAAPAASCSLNRASSRPIGCQVQDSPSKPWSHAHAPLTHIPCARHMCGHGSSEQSSPEKPRSHVQPATPHVPCPEQSFLHCTYSQSVLGSYLVGLSRQGPAAIRSLSLHSATTPMTAVLKNSEQTHAPSA